MLQLLICYLKYIVLNLILQYFTHLYTVWLLYCITLFLQVWAALMLWCFESHRKLILTHWLTARQLHQVPETVKKKQQLESRFFLPYETAKACYNFWQTRGRKNKLAFLSSRKCDESFSAFWKDKHLLALTSCFQQEKKEETLVKITLNRIYGLGANSLAASTAN